MQYVQDFDGIEMPFLPDPLCKQISKHISTKHISNTLNI